MNIGVWISVQVLAVNSFGYIPRTILAGSNDNLIFKFLMNCN